MQRRARPAAPVLVAVCLLALLSALVFPLSNRAVAQDKPVQGQFGERIEVREVLIDALVTDARGNVIVGLDKNDFVVREGGKPVQLSGVTFYSNRRIVETSAAVAKKGLRVDQVPEDRYFILFFDDQKSAAADAPVLLSQQLQAGRRAREWAARELLPNDWVAVVSYDYKLKVQQDFTHDRRRIESAIDDAIKGKDTDNTWPSRVKAQEPAGPSLLASLPRGDGLRDTTAIIFDGVERLAEAAGKITGRKNLLLFTHGFGRINSFGQYTPDPQYYTPMMEALNTANVAVYPIDLFPVGVRHPLADAMSQLAFDTGGRYFFDVVNYTTALTQVARENNGYYLLSYRSEHPAGKSGFQRVEVKTTNPEFKVKTRRGYEYGDYTGPKVAAGPAGP
jgi:VWFA-related protein